MTVLVAGATGLAGSAIAKAFESNGKEVIGVNRSVIDLKDFEATKKFLKKSKPSLVIDAAAKVGGIGANNSKPVEFLADNLQIQNNLMQGAFEAGVENFVFLGSSCVYPRDCAQPIKEDFLMTGPLESTNSAYAIAKIAGIEMINSYRKEHGLNWISLMPTNLYGPGDNFDAENSHVPAALIRKFYEAKTTNAPSVKIWGSGNAMREFMHVYDLADAIWFALRKPPTESLINVGFGSEISIDDFARKIAKITAYQGDLEFDTSMPEGTPRKLLDSTKFFEMGWRPKIPLDSGLESTYKWFRENIESGAVRGYDK